MTDVTRILSASEQGDPSAAAQLLPLVYDELRQTGQEALTIQGGTSAISSVALRPDGRRAVCGGVDGRLRAWDAATGHEALTLKGHRGQVTALAFSPDGTRLVSAGAGGTLKVWGASLKQQ